MGLRDEIKAWTQPNGLVSERAINPLNDTTGNGLLNLSLYYIALWNRKELIASDREAFHKTVKTCATSTLFSVPLNRSPTKIGDQNGWDDYIGVTTASLFLVDSFAYDIYQYGKASGWVYNNVDMGIFSFKAWFGRNPAVCAHFMLCGGKRLSWLERLSMKAFIYFRSEDATSQILAWCMSAAMVYSAQGPSTINLKPFLSQYLDPNHPIVRYWV